MNEKKKSKWGIGIALLYGSFVIFILGIVVFASMQDFHMVEQNYYDKELAYQQHIDKINRSDKPDRRLQIEQSPESGSVVITFPASINPNIISGNIVFFRPSDAAQDRKVEIEVDKFSRQEIELADLEKGRWKLMIYWQADSTEYFEQEEIYIQ